ncbi:MAG TPA: deoxyribose-phosphate aldolase [Thermoanaerobaculia bacterium]|nr:deoxyribose-phosphate aldolase [Thermoanaerobaculia bacterium]
MNATTLARHIDHTLLRPEATEPEVRRVIAEAAEHGFASVCIPPVHVPLAAGLLAGTPVRVGTVIAFPLGYAQPSVRRAESLQAIADGAQELDTVLNLSWLKGGEDGRVLDDLAAWVRAARAARSGGDGLTLKVIVETALLTDPEKERAARLAVECGADFVKTSTGFAKSGATVADVRLLAAAVAGKIGVKASGGIRDLETALAMLAAGATRLGTSSGVALVRALQT